MGHLDRVKRFFGYLAYLPEGAIRFRTGEPDFSDIQDQEFDWSRTVYGRPKEIIPTDITEPRGKYVTSVHYMDATSTMTWSLAGLSQPFSTLSMGHPQTGIPRDKQQ